MQEALPFFTIPLIVEKINQGDNILKALTIWQPYAQAIALGLKKFETRSWATKYRGPLAIHASIKPLTNEAKFLAKQYSINNFTQGAVILIADLTDCILMTQDFIKSQNQAELDFGLWQEGRYAWKLEHIKVLEKPIFITGKQGLWNLDISEK